MPYYCACGVIVSQSRTKHEKTRDHQSYLETIERIHPTKTEPDPVDPSITPTPTFPDPVLINIRKSKKAEWGLVQVQCGCGGKYLQAHRAKHFLTAKHKRY